MIRNDEKIKFGTDGWRGIIADGFTFNNVKIASRAIGNFILKNYTSSAPVLIGYDPRFLADKFAKVCANELINLGLKALISENIVPTPVIAFSAANLKSNGAIQFTASHNPPKYCGLKYITNYGGPAPVEITNEITELINGNINPGRDVACNVPPTFNPKNGYIAHIKNLVDYNLIKNANLKIVYDPLYGAGTGYLDYMLKEFGCEVITIHGSRDPLFGGLLPEPKEEFLTELKNSVISNKANLGLATDGDADRIGAVDENGAFFSPNKIAPMLLRHLFKNKKLKGKVVRTLSTTHMLDCLAKKYGLETVETKVGFKWICEEMQKGNVLIGAEESGGFSITSHIPDKDAILSGILLVEMMAYEKKSLAQIYKETIKDADWSCVNDRFDLHLNDTQKNYLISTLLVNKKDKVGDLKVKSINISEGAKFILEDGSWFLARASGTEPMARVYFEATSAKILEQMKSEVQNIVNQACQK